MIPVAVVALMPLVGHTELAAAVEKRRDELWQRAQEPFLLRYVNRNDSVPPVATQLERSSSRSLHGRIEAEVQPQDDPVAALARRNELSHLAKKHYLAGQLDAAVDKLSRVAAR